MRPSLHLLLALCLALLTPAVARAADQPAILSLSVNEVSQGEITVVLRGAEVWIAAADLEKAGVHGLAGRTEALFDRPMVNLSSIPGLRYRYDERALSLRITVPPSALSAQRINLQSSAPEGLTYRQDASAFLNYAARLTDFRGVEGSGEAGVSFDGNLLFSSVTASSTRGVIRGLSNLTVDDRKSLRRWVLGDVFSSAGLLGGGLFTAGLSVSRSFDLDPYFLRQPSFGWSGSAMTPSTLDVYVNGALVQRRPIAPGTFALDNLPVASGSGEARFVLRDAFGREQSFTTPFYVATGLLAPGLSEYTYTLGVARRNMGVKSFDYGAPALLARHRVGITDHVTLGGRFEASIDRVSLGPSLSLRLPVGQVDLAAGASATGAGLGAAGFASYSYVSRRFGVGVTAQAATARYATVSLDPSADRRLVDVSSFLTVAVGPSMSLSWHYAFALDRDQGASFRLGVSSTLRLPRNIGLIVTASRRVDPDGHAPMEFFAGLNYTFGSQVSASLGGVVNEDRPAWLLDVNKPLPRGTGVGFRASGAIGADPRGEAMVQAQAPYGRVQITGDLSRAGPHLALDAAGAIVAVRGAGVFLTRPVQDAFAVIRIPGARGVRGFIDNQEVGRTDADGNLLIPDLLPYYGNRLSVAPEDLPPSYVIGKTEQVIAPPFRGAALAVFAAKRARFYRGTVAVVDKGKRVIPAYGQLEVHDGGAPLISPIGRGGEIELQDIEPGPHRATITSAAGSCDFDLAIPAADAPIVDLGALTCAR